MRQFTIAYDGEIIPNHVFRTMSMAQKYLNDCGYKKVQPTEWERKEQLCLKFNTKIVILNNPDLSPQQEMVEDLVSIIHVFSCRIYGLRKYKKKIEEDEHVKVL